jgi:hypothetical protein
MPSGEGVEGRGYGLVQVTIQTFVWSDRETTKTIRRLLDRGLNSGPPEYEEALITCRRGTMVRLDQEQWYLLARISGTS